MRAAKLAAPIRLVLRIFRKNGLLNVSWAAALAAVTVAQIAAVLVATYHERTWHLRSPGRGLFDHYGAWAILISDPLLVMAVGYAFHAFTRTFSSLPARDHQKQAKLAQLTQRFSGWTSGAGYAAFGYLLCVVLGLFSWANNIRQTIDPLSYYGHDVFDSFSHPLGFAAYKLCLFTSWVLLYPIVGYAMLTMTVGTWALLKQIRARNLLRPDVTHPDNCYGLRCFGALTVALIAPYLIVYGVMFSLLWTHGSFYRSISIPLVSITILILATSYLVFMPSYLIFRDARAKVYDEMLSRSGQLQRRDDNDILQFAVERVCFAHAEMPYSGTAKVLLFVMNALPLLGVIFNALGPYLARVGR